MASQGRQFKNILIVKPSSLGDIILALPALTCLRKSFPHAQIAWLVRSEFAPLLENHPHLDRIILFDRKFLAAAWRNPRALHSLFTLIEQLRHSRFDLVLDFQGLFRTAALAWLSGCKNRFGMADAREFGHLFYTHKVRYDFDCIHLADYYLKIATEAGARKMTPQFLFPADNRAGQSVNHLLNLLDVRIDNYAVLVPGSAQKEKCWPVERFAELAVKISKQFNLSIVAVGSAAEKNSIDYLNCLSGRIVANAAGRTTLPQLVALLRGAKLVVSNDTGPGHIAAALGVPLVMIFGHSNPLRVGPYARPRCIAAIDPHKRSLRIFSSDPAHNVLAVSVDKVYTIASQQLQ